MSTLSKKANTAVIDCTVKGGEHSSHCLHYQRSRTQTPTVKRGEHSSHCLHYQRRRTQQSLSTLSKGPNTEVHCQRGRTQQSLSTLQRRRTQQPLSILSKGANTEVHCQRGRTQQPSSTLSKEANTAVIVYTVKGAEHSSHCLHCQTGRQVAGSPTRRPHGNWFSSLANDLYGLDTADNPKRSIWLILSWYHDRACSETDARSVVVFVCASDECKKRLGVAISVAAYCTCTHCYGRVARPVVHCKQTERTQTVN